MATKLNGVVIYRTFVGDHYKWAVRVYRNGKILFESCEFYVLFQRAVQIAQLVAKPNEDMRVQMRENHRTLYSDSDLWDTGWMDTWIKGNLKVEARLLQQRQTRQAKSFRQELSRSNMSTRTHTPSFVNPSDVINRKPDPRYT